VIVTFQVGGLEAYRHDVEIPRRYGLDQCVGDTLGPGGVFRFLRSAPAYFEIAQDMRELCPNALLINYANPMAMNCAYWSASASRRSALPQRPGHHPDAGGRPEGALRRRFLPRCGHQPPGLDFGVPARRGDLIPRLREVMSRAHLTGTLAGGLEADRGDHSEARGRSTYEGGQERVRTEVMAAFGYFHTESSHHASEYLPYFRKDKGLIEEMIRGAGLLRGLLAARRGGLEGLLARLKGDLSPSLEYGAGIIHSLETARRA
jgi:alpha-galactosidase